MLVVTTPTIEGAPIKRYIGMVSEAVRRVVASGADARNIAEVYEVRRA